MVWKTVLILQSNVNYGRPKSYAYWFMTKCNALICSIICFEMKFKTILILQIGLQNFNWGDEVFFYSFRIF